MSIIERCCTIKNLSLRGLSNASWRPWLAMVLWLALMTCTLPLAIAGQDAAEGQAAVKDAASAEPASAGESPDAGTTKPKNRAESVRAMMAHLGIGKGATVADIGAGGGQDTWVFAEVVGQDGAVLAQEITEGKVKKLKEEAKKKNLAQVRGVQGRHDDPCLPASSVDLAYVRYVYHHFSKPRKMLQGIWRGLKPGGYLVVVDKRRGTLQDWVSRDLRSKKHYWLAETTVVREAREEGFAFVECGDPYWHTNDPFILVFQRPQTSTEADGDPDPFLPLAEQSAVAALLPPQHSYKRPVFVALGEARKLIGPILAGSTGEGLDIILEEWATQKDERPPLPPQASLPSTLTEKGDPHLGPDPIDAVFFLDSYHLLFHGQTLLAKIHEKLMPDGLVYVLDREAKNPLNRREASHHRRISPEVVNQEMAAAGFSLRNEGPRLSADRFLLVFEKKKTGQIGPQDDASR
jgi:predicted methyltransferase